MTGGSGAKPVGLTLFPPPLGLPLPLYLPSPHFPLLLCLRGRRKLWGGVQGCGAGSGDGKGSGQSWGEKVEGRRKRDSWVKVGTEGGRDREIGKEWGTQRQRAGLSRLEREK